MIRLFCLSTITFVLLTTTACAGPGVEIQSCILRDRVIVTDHVFMKKAFYVAFKITNVPSGLTATKAKAQLFCGDDLLSKSSTISYGETTLNVVFDLPYKIPNAPYTIKVSLYDLKGHVIAECSRTLERSGLRSSLDAKASMRPVAFEELVTPAEPEHFKSTARDMAKGYVLFCRSYLEYVFPVTRPWEKDLVDHLSLTVCRNEFEPITFSLYPTKDLGEVKITIEDLTGPSGIISKERIEVGHVELVQDTIGCPKGTFRYMPRLIKRGDQALVEKGKTKRFWLTLRVDRDVMPGTYLGKITISPQWGKETDLPLSVTVLPVLLEDVPDVNYCMLMTYEFTELTMPWSQQDKSRIYDAACKVLRDYKEHGMTTICIHSPFVLIKKGDGSPNLDDIFAALRAARDTGFTRPVIWYMGHLIQTSKPRHPGNITGFDPGFHLPLLKELVAKVNKYAKDNHCPEVIFLPIDEADDSYNDYKGVRRKIAPVLIKAIRDAGGKSMLTATSYERFETVDYFCSSKLCHADSEKAHANGKAYWVYNNAVATDCRNPAYARYIYGYYTWKNGIDGMTTWTFQNTQNASGWPTIADAPGRDIFLAYPDPQGPLSTPMWEAVREGIEDHKLLYQLSKLIRRVAHQKEEIENREPLE